MLERCQRLREAGIPLHVEVGYRVARKFADLGYEEFYILPGRKIISLLTGQVAHFPVEHEQFFFNVLTNEEAVELLSRQGADIESLQYHDQRVWELTASLQSTGKRIAVSSESLDEAFLDLLIQLL